MQILLFVLWGIRTFRALLQQMSLWQIKEYRLDRLRAHLRTPSVLEKFFHPVSTTKWGFLLLFLLNPSWAASPLTQSALATAYAFEAAVGATEIFRQSFRRPRPTLKALGATALAVTFLAGLLLLAARAHVNRTVVLLTLDRLLPFLTAGAVLVLAPATAAHRSATIRRAALRMRSRRKLTTIGVTGSYGKSSTKEFLATILQDRYHVLKTPANVNTEIGIARVVLNSLEKRHDVFVCEMGAYRPQEIARTAAMIRPQIGILTAVSEQHLALFGSREAIAQAKGELLRSLPPNGTAIVNGDDPTCVRISKQSFTGSRFLRFGRAAEADVRATRVSVLPRSLRLTVAMSGAEAEFTVPLLGAQQVSSLLAATAAASVMGMTLPEIAEAATAIVPPPRTMEYRQGGEGTMIVDDTYSANPDGVVAAINFLHQAGIPTKVAIFTSMIELGRDAPGAHRRVGQALALARPDLTILTSPDYADEVIHGAADIHQETAQRIVVETDADRALASVRPLLGRDTIVLLEGRIPETLRHALLAPAP